MLKYNLIYSTLLLICLCACTRSELEIDALQEPSEFEMMNIPEGFDYATTQTVEITIQDTASHVIYSLYTYEGDTSNFQIATGAPVQGVYRYEATLPSSTQELFLSRNQLGVFSTTILAINQGKANFNYDPSKMTSKTDKADCAESLYAVNNQGQFFRIDLEDANYTNHPLPDLEGGGSIACAVDRSNNRVYYNTGTTLRAYSLESGRFEVISNGNPFNGNYPRMEYDRNTGLMYIARDEKMYILDPLTNSLISTYNITGLESPVGGGDVAISLDGTIYMCCFSGLYRVEIVGNTARATRISAENLPFRPTSMAIDRNDRLYLATNDAQSQLIEMDKFDGAWVVRATYDHAINDLGSFKCFAEELADDDTDDDGIPDVQDKFPNDPDKAFENYTPSKIGWGSLAFEDLWPSKGDFDFNDLVINYRFTAISNARNEVVAMKCVFKVDNIGASLTNGFGFELPISPDLIQQATGMNLTNGIINLNPNGTEAGQSRAVIIVMDNAFQNGNIGTCAPATDQEIQIDMSFNQPLEIALLGQAPFNPFIFVNQVRGHEVHLVNQMPTDLADTSLFGELQDDSNPELGRYYVSERNLPWAINIIHSFRVPREKNQINLAYNRFVQWAESGGAFFQDWYKDNQGYRNIDRICDR